MLKSSAQSLFKARSFFKKENFKKQILLLLHFIGYILSITKMKSLECKVSLLT